MEDTSLEAYREVKETLGDRQELVYNAILDLGEATNKMIAKYIGLPINSVTPRVLELRELKLVGVSKIDVCKLSPRRAIYWKVVR